MGHLMSHFKFWLYQDQVFTAESWEYKTLPNWWVVTFVRSVQAFKKINMQLSGVVSVIFTNAQAVI